MHRIVFVGGIPGSGKSQLCGRFRSLIPGLRHEVAGQLIRRAVDGGGGDYVRPPVADRSTADRFQDLLVGAFSRIRAEYGGPIVLDGHFVVPTEVGPSPVGADIFRRLGVTALVLVEAEAAAIVARLRERPLLGWWDGQPEAVADLISAERQQACVVAEHLRVPLMTFADGDEPERLVQEVFRVD